MIALARLHCESARDRFGSGSRSDLDSPNGQALSLSYGNGLVITIKIFTTQKRPMKSHPFDLNDTHRNTG